MFKIDKSSCLNFPRSLSKIMSDMICYLFSVPTVNTFCEVFFNCFFSFFHQQKGLMWIRHLLVAFFLVVLLFFFLFFCDVDDAPVGASWPVFAKFLSTAFLGLRT